ncbi:beta-N-acetylhexosaminidase [Streptomyces purpurogeneiscleroticus]|uniref:beta-N-acetylhexosaminidase n=1 Tax=Streptomyces purpurogeneiscleroticus TaxID=68259 RepID=UPI001CBB4DB3|nr:glycoside hydrolase family 20 protein [Streptomyces purpurogeneiscleroticus]MBZ4017495.1 beta-N-acetylglucosaminidase [Streptomyces purpurogeneiscleroticus]
MRKLTAWVALAASALTITGCSDGSAQHGGGSGTGNQDSKSPTSAASSAAPTPRWAAVKGPPRTIPAVRGFKAADGTGWRVSKNARVVVPAGADSPVADEARRLAADLGGLKLSWKDDARPGDVELTLSGKGKAAGENNAAPASTADESYTITARDTRLTLTAPTDTGIFNATRTVVQSVRAAGGVPEGTLQDRPDRAQRGLLVDTARKHFSADWLEKRIREMADLKLNQLQLHFSDDQAFRIESSSHPEIVSKDHLTKAQVRHLVKLARELHITVIPEIDSPGHLGAVIDKHPSLQLRSAAGTAQRGAIDISQPKAAQIVDDLLREYAKLFAEEGVPGPRWHLGGDEYRALTVKSPGATYPQLARAATKKYGARATVQDLTTGWLNDREKTLRKAGVQHVEAWNDGFHDSKVVTPDKDRTVAYWTGKEIGAREPLTYLKEGRTVVNLNDEYLYYVLGQPNDFTYPTGERIYKEWTPAVLRGSRPVPASLAGPDRIPGARFGVWCDLAQSQTTEQVARGIRLPLAALSQKVWDPRKPQLSWTDFKSRAATVAPAR